VSKKYKSNQSFNLKIKEGGNGNIDTINSTGEGVTSEMLETEPLDHI